MVRPFFFFPLCRVPRHRPLLPCFSFALTSTVPIVDWRVSGDIQATFSSVLSNVDATNIMAALQGPTGGPFGGGRWNDADMLQVSAGPQWYFVAPSRVARLCLAVALVFPAVLPFPTILTLHLHPSL